MSLSIPLRENPCSLSDALPEKKVNMLRNSSISSFSIVIFLKFFYFLVKTSKVPSLSSQNLTQSEEMTMNCEKKIIETYEATFAFANSSVKSPEVCADLVAEEPGGWIAGNFRESLSH